MPLTHLHAPAIGGGIFFASLNPNGPGLRTLYKAACERGLVLYPRYPMTNLLPSLRLALGALAVGAGLSLAPAAHAGHTNVLLKATLDGSAEVSGDGDTSQLVGDATGMGQGYVFGIDGDMTTLCYSLEVTGIQLVPVGEGMAAHIHEGAMDENGPVVAVLAGPEDGNAADCLTEGEEGKFPTGEAGIVQRILKNPGDFYINVHNPQFPAGAVRGQLVGPSHSH